MRNNQATHKTYLRRTRDLLLPRLVSEEIRVDEVKIVR